MRTFKVLLVFVLILGAFSNTEARHRVRTHSKASTFGGKSSTHIFIKRSKKGRYGHC